MITKALIGLALLFAVACDDKPYGTRQEVTVYSGGVAVAKFITDGDVFPWGGHDLWRFSVNGRSVMVSGTLIIKDLETEANSDDHP